MTAEQLSMSMFANRADYDAAVRAQGEQFPDGLQHDDEQRANVVTGSPAEIWLCYGDIDSDADHVECSDVLWCEDKQDQSDVRYVRADLADAEHTQRLTLQHHACDQAQRIVDLEAKCDTLKRLHDAAADERDSLQGQLTASEASDAESIRMYRAARAKHDELLVALHGIGSALGIPEGDRSPYSITCGTLERFNKLAEIEAQEPVAYYRSSDADWLDAGQCATMYKSVLCDWDQPLYARPVPAQAVPVGWWLVPVEPTPEMARAGHYRYCAEFVKDYKLMIAAAPEHKA